MLVRVAGAFAGADFWAAVAALLLRDLLAVLAAALVDGDFLAAVELRLAVLLVAAVLRVVPLVFGVEAEAAAVVGGVAAKVVMAWLLSLEAARALVEVRRVGAGGAGRDADAERELMERSFCLGGPIAGVTRL